MHIIFAIFASYLFANTEAQKTVLSQLDKNAYIVMWNDFENGIAKCVDGQSVNLTPSEKVALKPLECSSSLDVMPDDSPENFAKNLLAKKEKDGKYNEHKYALDSLDV